jgi:beta-lactamase regulating signal transducer with metallopeptidase domain
MNPAPALECWWRFAAVFAVEVAMVVLIAGGLQMLIASAVWRRTIWQVCAVTVLALICVEASGGSRMVASLLASEPKPPTRAAPPPSFAVSATEISESASEPDFVAANAGVAVDVAQKEHCWWPGMLWLAGAALLSGRVLIIRFFFLLRARQGRVVTDAELIRRVHDLTRQLALRRRVRVVEMSGLRGPIAFGIVRLTIGLPRDFSTFGVREQDAMLIHELAHLAARDPAWYTLVDFLTALAWWHPLSWWIRRQLHATTEAAADEACVLVENGPDILAEALVRLGNRLLERQRLGLLGIGGNGFRSSLGRRVERLMKLSRAEWSPVSPVSSAAVKMAGPLLLTGVASLCCAWMVPGDSGRGSAWNDSLAGRSITLIRQTLAVPTESAVAASADTFVGQQSAEPVTPISSGHSTNVVYPDKGRQTIYAKLERIRFSSVTYDSLPLGEVVKSLAEEVRKRDPHSVGLQFLVSKMERPPAPIDPATGEPVGTPAQLTNVGNAKIRIVPPLTDVTLGQVLDAIVKVADQPIKYSIENYAIVFSTRSQDSPPLHTRTFKVDPHTFMSGLQKTMALHVPPAKPDALELPASNLTPQIDPDASPLDRRPTPVRRAANTNGVELESVRQLLRLSGVELAPPKAIFWNDRLGMLMVRATLTDLDAIEQVLQVVNAPPPQVTIEARIAEIPEAAAKQLGLDWLGTTVKATISKNQPRNPFTDTNSATANYATVLTAQQFRILTRALEQKAGVDVLTAPRVTTLSGRQTQIKVVEVKHVVTGIDEKDQKGVVDLKVTKHELGPAIDTVPVVRADGYTIDLTVITTSQEFLGYEPTSETVKVLNDDGTIGSAPMPLPTFRVYQAVAAPRVWDGQTFAMGLGRIEGKERIVFVTVSIIDPAGNMVHSEEDGQFRTLGIPPQQ